MVPDMFTARVERYDTIESTMDRARELANEGAPEGTLVIADQQTAGRGTGGRRWLTPPGSQLAFSFIVRPPLETTRLFRLTMWIGLSLYAAASPFVSDPDRVRLKWPNDLLIAGRKAAGILVEGAFEEGRLRHAVIGVGFNVSASPPDEDVDFRATHLDAHAAAPVDRQDLLRAILSGLEERYPQRLFEPGLIGEWRSALWWPDGPMSVQTGGGEWIGRVVDVTEMGALVLDTDQGRRLFETGRLRPTASGPYNAPEGGSRHVR